MKPSTIAYIALAIALILELFDVINLAQKITLDIFTVITFFIWMHYKSKKSKDESE